MPQLNHVDSLRDLYGSEFVAADVRGYCASEGVTYQTVTKHLEQYKVGRGKWNLEVTQDAVETIESAFEAPAAVGLVPTKDDNFVPFDFPSIKKIIKSKIFIPPSSLVSLAMVKPLESNKHVLNSDEKSFELTSQLKRTKMISSAVSGCLTAILFGTTGLLFLHLGEEHYCSLTKSTSPATKSSACNLFSKATEFLSRKPVSTSNPHLDSM